MALFLLSVSYTASEEEVQRVLPKHFEWLISQYDKGVYLSFAKKVPATGGVCFATAKSLDEIVATTNTDPFTIEKVAKYEIQEVALTKMNPAILELAEMK
ncbi:hypothetical protein DL98DRAFT_499674 [Cadophora sp. DSE1049]|nr:hypothetical protein DL98DRAFT_499674 [Cadophora sp. DSE1049]